MPSDQQLGQTIREISRSPGQRSIQNAMSVDVEDYFQVHALSGSFSRARWDEYECRVEANLDRVLQLFDDAGISATFFTLAWIAERYPNLVKKIVSCGHELASHGLDHTRADGQEPLAFRDDVRKSKHILEDAGACEIFGYRAASFSIGISNQWAFSILEEEGYKYSSSIYPIRHDHYGMVTAPRFAFRPAGCALLEIPISTVHRFGLRIPCGGGGYFRLLPYTFSKANLQYVNFTENEPCIFYFHPWELDPGQPRPLGVPWRSRIRHYLNLGVMEDRLVTLLRDFSWNRIDRLFMTNLPTQTSSPTPAEGTSSLDRLST